MSHLPKRVPQRQRFKIKLKLTLKKKHCLLSIIYNNIGKDGGDSNNALDSYLLGE
jgi:hypothetical protein